VISFSRLRLAIKAVCELGLRQLGLYALYRIGLRTGYFKAVTRDTQPIFVIQNDSPFFTMMPVLKLPDPQKITNIIGKDGLTDLIVEADEIVRGKVRLFGGEPVPLRLSLNGRLFHWADYETGKAAVTSTHFRDYPAEDIKFIWEPARFGWAITLARAYHLTSDERYPQAFWRYFEEFHKANPVNIGPHWVSAQEVGLRLITMSFCGVVFAGSTTSDEVHKTGLAASVASHARRIMATLIYARSQNNNHLLSEAAGLITASMVLPVHPDAKNWQRTGWRWFNRGLETQIDDRGVYIQNSTNYHRLMLQIALWIYAIQKNVPSESLAKIKPGWAKHTKESISKPAYSKLKLAAEWLMTHVDTKTGRAPNLGPNDGAHIFPLTVNPFFDYRPVVQAAARSFLGYSVLDPGTWDETGLWLNLPMCDESLNHELTKSIPASDIIAHLDGKSWVYLRAAKFFDRPGHADQLHVDLWWRGLNIAQDAGTYLYTAEPPWDNSLTNTAIHNTIMIDGMEQMTRTGRFLYLDRAQGEVVSHNQDRAGSRIRLSAWHDGYSKLGVLHSRSVTFQRDGNWLVQDHIQQIKKPDKTHNTRLHWLLPDWEIEPLDTNCGLRLHSPYGWITLVVTLLGANQTRINDPETSIVRAGELLYGTGPISPTWGWVSPTYGVKMPAISYAVRIEGQLPFVFISEWCFPG